MAVYKITVDSALITPSTVDTNGAYHIAISVTEIEIEQDVLYCGTFSAGEEVV